MSGAPAASWRSAAGGALAGAGASALATLLMVRRYLQRELRAPKLLHGGDEESAEARRRVLEVELLLRDYWPHPLLEFSGYASTAWSGVLMMLSLHRKHPGHLEETLLKDGGTASLHWAEPPDDAAGADRIVVLFPGLCNDSRTFYMQDCMRHLREEGFQAVTFNYRGVGGNPLTSRRMGSFDAWQDVPEIVARIRERRPAADLFAIGFSMGGGILLKYLGEAGSAASFRAAVAVAAPTDIPRVADSLESSPKKLALNAFMAAGVKLMIVVNGIWRSPFLRPHLPRIFRALTLRQIDDSMICAMNGYRDAEEYWRFNNPLPVLHSVSVPTLIANAEDDPVISCATISKDQVTSNPNMYLAFTKRGGHIGWGSGGDGVACWSDRMAAHFLRVFASAPAGLGKSAGSVQLSAAPVAARSRM